MGGRASSRNRAHDAPPQRPPHRLFWPVAVRMLAAFVVVGVVVHLAMARQVRDQAIEAANFHALFSVEQVLAATLTAEDLQSPMALGRWAELLPYWEDRLLIDGVVGFLVYSPTGTILISDNGMQAGFMAPDGAAETDGRQDLVGVITDAPQGQSDPETGYAVELVLETVVPYPDEEGAAEGLTVLVRQNAAPLLDSAAAAIRTLDLLLFAGFLLLYGAVTPLVRRASRTLERQADQLSEHLTRERETVERLVDLDRSKSLFLSAVSHELRTPLAVVRGVAEVIERHRDRLTEDQHELLMERLYANAMRLDHLLADLLDVQRLERGVVLPDRKPARLDALVHRVLAMCDLGARRVTIDVPRSQEVPIDVAQIERALENLVRNAERHTPSGTPIWIRTEQVEEGTLLVVEDAGPGVPVEIRQEIFQPFVHGPTAPSHSPGTGVGLAIVARFAELHGGRAWVEERAGGGASFRMLIAHGLDETDIPSPVAPELQPTG